MHTTRIPCHYLVMLLCLLGLAAAAGLSTANADDGYTPANTLPWPLRVGDGSEQRPAVWSSLGEYQYYGGPRWFHSGFDIRGVYRDRIVVVDSGNAWMVANLEQCNEGPTEGGHCRLYVKSSDERYVYYYSHLFLGPETDFTSTARAKIMNASPKGAAAYTVNPDTDVAQGETLAFIANFSGNWDHLHFGIVAATENYDMVHPLTALAGLPVDDERPTIDSLSFYEAGTPETSTLVMVTPQGDCQVVSGNLDIVANMEDTFYTTSPAPADITGGETSTGVYEARYLVRRADATSPSIDNTWYRFDRVPISCTGPNRGTSCSSTATENDFFAASIDDTQGAAHWGKTYARILYADALTCPGYSGSTCSNGLAGETYAHILTNSWGQDGSWNTAADSNGVYQVSTEARDHAGNRAARSRFVYVHNDSTPFDPNNVAPDAYVRDNLLDIGALPSTLGGQPFWTSPDIIIVPSGTPVPADSNFAGTGTVTAGTPYDVYVRVHNDRCVAVNNISARVYSANPALIIDESEWVELTGGGFVGDTSVPAGGVMLLGPFPWTPTEAEGDSNNGHRCMLAYITSGQDPYTAFPDVVQDNNNIAQRNLQVENSSFDISNPEPASASVEIDFNCNELPIHEPRTVARLNVEYHPVLADAWAQVPGTRLRHDTANNQLHLDFQVCRIRMPPAVLPAHLRLPASVDLVLPPHVTGSYVVDFAEHVNGDLRGGMSFSVSNVIVE